MDVVAALVGVAIFWTGWMAHAYWAHRRERSRFPARAILWCEQCSVRVTLACSDETFTIDRMAWFDSQHAGHARGEAPPHG